MAGMLLLLLLYSYLSSRHEAGGTLRMSRYCKHGTFDVPVALRDTAFVQAVPKASVVQHGAKLTSHAVELEECFVLFGASADLDDRDSTALDDMSVRPTTTMDTAFNGDSESDRDMSVRTAAEVGVQTVSDMRISRVRYPFPAAPIASVLSVLYN